MVAVGAWLDQLPSRPHYSAVLLPSSWNVIRDGTAKYALRVELSFVVGKFFSKEDGAS